MPWLLVSCLLSVGVPHGLCWAWPSLSLPLGQAARLSWVGLGFVGLGWVRPSWTGLSWAGLA